jgi:hypothetical protein
MQKKYIVRLTDQERTVLEEVVQSRSPGRVACFHKASTVACKAGSLAATAMPTVRQRFLRDHRLLASTQQEIPTEVEAARRLTGKRTCWGTERPRCRA